MICTTSWAARKYRPSSAIDSTWSILVGSRAYSSIFALASGGNLDLFGLALVLAIGAALAGAVVPALGACRLTPVEAMRRQE